MEVVLDKFEAFVGVNFFTMIFAWINLVILYVFLKKLLFKPVKNMIDSRQKEIDDMYSDAENAKQSANEMKAEYEEKISSADAESEEILRRAVRRAELREEEILKEADKKAARIMERAEEQIELEKKRAVNDVKDEVSSIALGIAEAVIERDIDKNDHNSLIEEFIDKLGEKA
ncbi:MAG: F0F1 ATP synthase subunit B [Ruminococcaceae bacterium]|nr:F0F1 ATP synthase subunit B [Oscillospiraceae bacterium]